jgi:hypothetical protein
MMGRREGGQGQYFYSFDLDKVVPPDHLVRQVEWLVDRGITPHIPVWDKSARSDGTFSRSDFIFHPERNIYVCPGGAKLTSTGNIDQGHIV